MPLITILFAAQALAAAEIAPSRFYVAGIQQGMTLADYNSMISNGGFKSQPIGPDRYQATINGQDIYVDFCGGQVVGALASYLSADWLLSLRALEARGFKFNGPFLDEADATGEMRTGSIAFSGISPKDFRYGVLPMIKTASFRDKDLPSFQLSFRGADNACRQ
jgi:hypothetical protein